MKALKTLWQRSDALLIMLILGLMGGSLLVLYGNEEALLLRQGMRFGAGWLLFFAIVLLPPIWLKRLTPWFYVLTVVLLALVLLIGVKAGGAQRWLNLGAFRLQPSELAKITVPMMVAWYSTLHHKRLSLREVAVNLALILLPVILIFKEPDLGTTLLVAAAACFALFLAGLPVWFMLGAGLLLLIASPLFWFYGIKDYQRDRIMTFLNPDADPWGNGYHIIQSKIAIGSGGWEGKGYQQGTQSQLEFLPESTTDFVFSVIGEEFGLLGVLLLLTVYGLLIARGLYLASRLQQAFARIVVATTFLSFFINVFVNIGMVSGILPVVGLPLAFISYGGSSILSLMVGMGIACNLASTHEPQQDAVYLAHRLHD